MALALDVSGILAVKEVSVVQSIDVAALQAVLLQLVSKQAAAENQLDQQREVIEGLKAQLTSQPAAVEGVDSKAAAANPGLTKQDSNRKQSAAVDALQTELQQLKTRVAHLEQLKPQHAADQAVLLPSASAQPAESQAVHTAAARDAAPKAADNASAAMDALRSAQEQLAQQIADLRDSLAGTADSILQQLSTGLSSKADASVAQGLQDLLLNKADQSAVDQLRKAIAEKADRSELDSLLNSLSASAAAPGAAVDGESTPAGAGPGGDAGGGAADAAAARALQLQLTMLQDRLGKKADASALEDAAAGLAAAHQELAALKLTITQLNAQLADVSKSLSDVRNLQQQTGQRLASVQLTAPAAIAPSIAASSHAGTSDISWAQEIQQMLPRLAAVEATLRAVPPAAPGDARTTARTDSKGSTTSSGVPPVESGLIQPYARGIDSTLQQLASDAADLRSQVTQLKQAVSDLTCSRSMTPAQVTFVQSHQASDSTGPTVSLMNSLQGPASAAAELADAGLVAVADETALEDAIPGGQELDADAAVMLEDLSARLAGLQALVDSLVASKADRGEVERVQAMLADTATQSDTDMLRHKLDAQQQQLARLQSATQRLAGNTTGAADSAASPRDAATRVAAIEASATSPGARVASPGAVRSGGSSAAAAEVGGVGAVGTAPDDVGLKEGTLHLGSSIDADQMLAGIEQLAQAVCLLATGQAAAAAVAGSGGESFSFKSSDVAGSTSSREGNDAARDASVGATTGVIGPHMARLKRLLQTGQVGGKLDWFDPTLLQKMAQRLAAAEALIKNAHAGSSGMLGSGGYGDLEARVRKLAAELRLLKERLGDSKPTTQGGWRAGDGDHTMLAAKPLAGYRCMACDRPLGSLDPSPGPYLPSGQMPLPVPADMPASAGKLPPAGGSSRRNTVQDAVGVPGNSDATSPDNPGRRVTGPQNWYASAHGPPAEHLPRADVGPHLPPGGWRAGQPREDGTVLPALGSKGGANSPLGR